MPQTQNPAFFRKIVAHVPVAVLALDTEGWIVFCNPHAAGLLGYSPTELIGQPVAELLGVDSSTLVADLPEVQRLEFRNKHGDSLEVQAKAIPGKLADQVVSILFLEAAPPGREDYQALLEAEALFHAFMSTEAVLTWMKDEELRYVYANGPYEELLGFGAEELLGQTDFDFRGAAVAAELQANDYQVLRSGERLETFEMVQNGAGETRHHQVYKFPFTDSAGRRFVGGLSVDVTVSKEAEEALRQSEASYRSLFENVLDGIYRTTVDGHLLAANPALVQMLGYNSVEELKQADVAADLYADPSVRQTLQEQLVREGATRNVEISVRTKDGRTISVLDNSHLVRDEQGRVLYSEGTLTDITALKQREHELEAAYDATIEGWSRALELRDKETRGHTERVAYITEKLAREFGLDEAELVHIRRGALLHDIGKMGVPDGVLRKTGPLTDEEWLVMRQHPQYARDMLWGIAYLRPALDIPYCHHEKWDGSGYPQGLKGEEIPLSARLFAVADVWDALRSDRPYRAAWDEEKVLAYIADEAGHHFDPEVAAYFLRHVDHFRLETSSLGEY